MAFSILCFIFDFSGIFFGTSLFNIKVNMLQILFHFVGGILLSWVITEHWTYEALWPIVIATNIPTALIEVWLLMSIHIFRLNVF